MTVRVYRYDDASAPVLTGAIGSVNDLIRACLVTGYGAKAGAGWTEEFIGTETNISAYKMGAAPFNYLRVNDSAAVSSNSYTRIIGYNTMTDINTGTNPFPTEAQVAGGLYFWKSLDGTTARPWMIIADNNAFWLFQYKGATIAQGFTSTTHCDNLFFGKLFGTASGDTNSTTIIANQTTGNSYVMGGTADFSNINGHYINNRYDGSINTDSSIQTGKRPLLNIGTNNLGVTTTQAYPDPVTNGLLLSRVYIGQSSAPIFLRGYLPGMWSSINLSNSTIVNGDTFSSVINGVTRTFICMGLSFTSQTGFRGIFEISDTWEL